MTEDKKKEFKKLEELLKMEDSVAFDQTQADEEAKKLEARRNLLKEINDKRKKLEDVENVDDYMGGMLKELVSMGMKMLTSLQIEIEDAPRGRDVETAASMMSAINGVIDNINKIKIYNAKMDLERQKLELKIRGSGNMLEGGTTNNQNIIMIGSSNDIQDFLIEKGILPGNNMSNKVKDASVIKSDDEIING